MSSSIERFSGAVEVVERSLEIGGYVALIIEEEAGEERLVELLSDVVLSSSVERMWVADQRESVAQHSDTGSELFAGVLHRGI